MKQSELSDWVGQQMASIRGGDGSIAVQEATVQ